jgi:MSHA pilin protein MshD
MCTKFNARQSMQTCFRACVGMSNPMGRLKQHGISLIELIIFIVIISFALVGILLVMNRVTGSSADPLVRKQALAIAESLLDEIELQNFSKPAGGYTGPFTPANRSQFDSVGDYNGFTTTGILAVDGVTPVAGLAGYNISPAVTVLPTTSALAGIPAGSAVVITISVTGPGGTINLTGYRAAY